MLTTDNLTSSDGAILRFAVYNASLSGMYCCESDHMSTMAVTCVDIEEIGKIMLTLSV